MKENQTIHLRDGRQLGFAEYGDQDGTPLFFFHGWPSSRLQAKVLDEVAKKSNIRIISPDRPGYGLSDFNSDRKLLDWPDTVQELADNLEISTFSVVGVSGGGPYAAVCAYKIPERIEKTGIVVGLAPTNIDGVLEGMAILNKLTWWSYHRLPILMEISSLIGWLQVRTLLPSSDRFSYQAKADQDLLQTDTVKQDMLRTRKEAFIQGKRGAAHDLRLYTSEWGFDLAKIVGEVLLWYGDKDKNVSVNMGKYYRDNIPNSHLHVYPNEGHFLIQNHAQEIINELCK